MKYVACTCALLALMASSCGGSRFNIGEGDDGVDQDGGPMSGGSAGTGGASTGGSAGSGGSTGGSSGSGGSSGGGGGYEPCENKPCGAECSRCDPADPTCADLAVLMYCDDSGNCGQAFPVCATSQCTTSADCPQVGAPCELCPDNTYACPSVECIGGECVGSFPACQGSTCTSDSECPTSDAPCQVCPDGSSACPWARCEMGTCVSGYDTCGTTDPCQGKLCGDSCHPCDGIPGCLGPPITMYCDENLTCQTGAPPACGTTNRCMSDLDCPAVELCSPCPDGMACAEMRCIAGVCSLTCDTSGMCSAQGDSCANGETCCQGLQCCGGVPVPPGEEYCGATCLD